MDLTAIEQVELGAETARPAFFFRLATPDVQCLWLGVGTIEPGAHAYDPTGTEVYNGFGQIAPMPAFSQMMNGQAERVAFTLSGISPQILMLTTTADAPLIKQAAVAVGFALFDPGWKLLGPIHWMWRGYGDYLAAAVDGASSPEGQTTCSVTLSAGSLMTGRRRQALVYWTDQDQRQISPTDSFCERTLLISQVAQKVWPRF